MVKSYLIDGKSIRSNSQYRGTALRAISRFVEYMVFAITQSVCLSTFTRAVCRAREQSITIGGEQEYDQNKGSGIRSRSYGLVVK